MKTKADSQEVQAYLDMLAELERRVQNIPTPEPTIYVTDDELDEMEKNPQWGTDTV